MPLLLSTTSLVSNVPMFVHLGILAFDGVLFYGLALLCSDYQFQMRRKRYVTPHDAVKCNTNNISSCSISPQSDSRYAKNTCFRFSFCACVACIRQYLTLMSSDSSSCDDNNSNYEQIATKDTSDSDDDVEQPPLAPHQHDQYHYQTDTDSDTETPRSSSELQPDLAAGLIVSDVSKSFISTEKECQIEVLHHIRARLHAGCVTTLLGSNGGGWVVVMRCTVLLYSDLLYCTMYAMVVL